MVCDVAPTVWEDGGYLEVAAVTRHIRDSHGQVVDHRRCAVTRILRL